MKTDTAPNAQGQTTALRCDALVRLPTAAPTHSEIAWYVRELTEARAREEKALDALRLVAKHVGVESAFDAALLPPNK